jgi:hypothetical protein
MAPTESQRAVRAALLTMGELFFENLQSLPSGLRLRLSPLVVGPPGSGKTHLIGGVAATLSADYIRLCRSEWIPEGSTKGRPTLYRVLDRLAVTRRVLVHIDELCKLQIDFGAQEWSASIACEILNLADRILPVAEYLRETQFPGRETPTADEVNSWVMRGCWVVGSGAWQRVYQENRAGSAIGFERAGDARAVTADTIARSRLISPEILFRFNSEILFISVPGPVETAQLLESTGINALASELGITIAPEEIQWENKGGMRVLETLATRLVMARYERDRKMRAETRTEPAIDW